ncbi:MAG: 2-oxo acid dehydrogenase subunit E2 [Capsulimonadales bacterium]|nr:2-oxo acid dehydrogenase subunit E2 [Capsulimonadales bacterium]
MAKTIKMPVLGNSVEEVRILQWFKKVGDRIQPGDPLAEIETDKTSMEWESADSGVVRQILAEADSYVKVEAPVLIVTNTADEPLDGAEPVSAVPAVSVIPTPPASAPSATAPPILSPRAQRVAADLGVDPGLLTGRGTGPKGRVQEKDVLAVHAEISAAAATLEPAVERLPKVSPLARAVASGEGVDLSGLVGSGAGGRITAQDVRSAAMPPEPASPEAAAAAPVEKSDSRTVVLTGLRKRVADNLMRSVREKPHVTLNTAVDMTEAMRLRAELLPVLEKATGIRISPTDIIVKASAVALREHPSLNAHIEGDHLTRFDSVHVGLAVSLGDEGLIVPVIRNVERKGLSELLRDREDLVKRARAGKLGSNDLAGGTFTVTNLGNYGITSFDPIIPPPQVAILGVGAIADTVVARNGQAVIRPMMGLSLSFDHRATDGAPAAAFLARLREILELPYLLLL